MSVPGDQGSVRSVRSHETGGSVHNIRRVHTTDSDSDKDLAPVHRVSTSGTRGEYVHLGDRTYLKSDLIYAFGGTFNPGVSTAPHLKLGNASPMGLFGFATTNLMVSFINARARGVSNPGITFGCALFFGGIIQTIAGVWELVLENTFGATVFTTFGGFWMSFATISMDGFNIKSSYTSEVEFANAMGLFNFCWLLVGVFFLLCNLRSTVGMFLLFLSLVTMNVFLTTAQFAKANGSDSVSEALTITGGVFGCINALLAYYNAMAGLLTPQNSFIEVKPHYLPWAVKPQEKDT